MPTNQCDGCKAGLVLRDGMHTDGENIHMACTAEQYDLDIEKMVEDSEELEAAEAIFDKLLAMSVDKQKET